MDDQIHQLADKRKIQITVFLVWFLIQVYFVEHFTREYMFREAHFQNIFRSTTNKQAKHMHVFNI